MPDIVKEVTCSRCGHTWYVNFTDLEREQKMLIFKGNVEQRKYSVQCPNCDTRKTLTLRIEEEGHG
jgi:hypothetical protein